MYLALKEEIPDLVAMSLRDRDDEPAETVGPDLVDGSSEEADFLPRRWRRRYIESYLICPPAIAAATGLSSQEVEQRLSDHHGLAVGSHFDGCPLAVGLAPGGQRNTQSWSRSPPSAVRPEPHGGLRGRAPRLGPLLPLVLPRYQPDSRPSIWLGPPRPTWIRRGFARSDTGRVSVSTPSS